MAFLTPIPNPHHQFRSPTLKSPLHPSTSRPPSTRTTRTTRTTTMPKTPTPNAPHTSARPPTMLVVEASNIIDMDKILDAADNSLVVVDYSTTWCGPCKAIAPLFEELSEKYTDVVFVKVMGDASPDTTRLMQREGIRAVPAFHFWKDGSKVQMMTGAKSDELEKLIVSLK